MRKERIRRWRTFLDEKTGEHRQLQESIKAKRREIRTLKRDKDNAEEARQIIQLVAQETQQQLEYRISELATLAMAGVFENPYNLELEFVQKRGKTEAIIQFERDGVKINPEHCTGGGAQDVASFALQVSLWGIKRNRPIMILDEPLKWLKGGQYPERGAEVIREISEKLGLQVVMVSHIPDQIEHADHVIDLGGAQNAKRTKNASRRVSEGNRGQVLQRRKPKAETEESGRTAPKRRKAKARRK